MKLYKCLFCTTLAQVCNAVLSSSPHCKQQLQSMRVPLQVCVYSQFVHVFRRGRDDLMQKIAFSICIICSHCSLKVNICFCLPCYKFHLQRLLRSFVNFCNLDEQYKYQSKFLVLGLSLTKMNEMFAFARLKVFKNYYFY